MKYKEYSHLILEISKEYRGTQYEPLVDKAVHAYICGDYITIDEMVSKLPTDIVLLENLIKKLKGKSVYTNLRKLLEGKETSIEQELISTASLIVHVGIEMKENIEYKKLLPDLHKKLGIIINKVRRRVKWISERYLIK